MALVTANGVAVISGTVVLPLTGAWIADLHIDQVDGTGFAAGTQVTIATGNLGLVGVVQPSRTGDFLDAVHVRVIGGAGGLGKTATARAFVQPGAFVSDVVNGLIADSGEKLSVTTDQAFLTLNLAAWSTTPKPVAQCLQILIDIINRQQGTAYNWRILADGTLWIGQESWPSASGTFDTIRWDPADASWDLGVESPFIMPGTTLTTVGQVGRVEHRIEAKKIRQFVWTSIAGGDRGIDVSVSNIAKRYTAGIDFFGLYEANIIAQSADGTTLDVQPIDKRFAGMQRIALRHGLPGLNVQVAPGSTILMGFRSGDPSQPFVHSWKGGETITAITIGSATDNVATKQDLSALLSAISGATIVAQDGGASFKATLLAALAPPVMVPAWPVCSNTVKVQR